MTEMYVTLRVASPDGGGEPEDRAAAFVKGVLDAAGAACTVVEVTRHDPAFVTVSYSPQAIRAHFEGDEEAEERLGQVGDAALFESAAGYLAGCIGLWADYHGHCEDILAGAEKPADDPAG